jgi:type IV pilus assembly protein PilA
MLKNLRKKKKGFTLIELIVVIAIIAILSAIAIPKFGSIKQNAKEKADLSNAKIIANMVTVLYESGEINPITTAEEVTSTTKIGENLQEIPKTAAGNSFYVTIDTVGKVKVFNGNTTTIIYPKQ